MKKRYYFILISLFCVSVLSGQNAYQQKLRQDIINTTNPIYAKIETPTPNGLKIEIVKKTDTIRIKQLKRFKDSYQIAKTEYVIIDTTYNLWVKKWTTKNCCFSSDPRGCQVWCLAERKINITEPIPIYQLVKIKTIKPSLTPSITCTIFPNPFTNKITLQAVKNIDQVVIMDNAGKFVHQEKINSMERTIYIENLPKGVYIVQVFIDKAVSTFQITKQ